MKTYMKLYTIINNTLICIATSKKATHTNYFDFWRLPQSKDSSIKYALALCSTKNGNIAYRSISEQSAISFFRATRISNEHSQSNNDIKITYKH